MNHQAPSKRRYTNSDLAELIHNVARSQIAIKDELRAEFRTQLRTELGRLDRKTDEIIDLLRDYIGFASDKHENHERRITTLEQAAR